MKTIELFSGTGSFSKVAKDLGHETFTTDNDSIHNPDLIIDIFNQTILKHIPYKPDILWASPPCQGFSVASIGKMWNRDGTPKHNTSRLGLKLLQRTIEIIEILEPKFWFIENPRGMMRKVPQMLNLHKTTVTYCQYGDTRMKPTDIFNNLKSWEGKICKNGSDCHTPAPRGSKQGTQGIKGSIDRGVIPPALFHEIFAHINKETK